MNYALCKTLGKCEVCGITQVVAGGFLFAIAIVIVLCLRLNVVKMLLMEPEVWYFICAALMSASGTAIVKGTLSFQTWSLPVFMLGSISFYIVVPPLADALPFQMRSFFGKWAAPVVSIMYALNFAMVKLGTARIYSETDVPELGVPGIATLSGFQMFTKGQFLVAILSARMTFRVWRHPDEAMMLHTFPLLSALHPSYTCNDVDLVFAEDGVGEDGDDVRRRLGRREDQNQTDFTDISACLPPVQSS